jgi:hypothetical protein
MWNFTDDGFTSVVEYDPPAKHWDRTLNKQVDFDDGIINNLPADYQPADKEALSTHVLVRARIREDLDALLTYDPDAIQTEDQRADYQFRLVMRRTAYATYMFDKVMTLDYNSHVKETIDKRAPKIVGGRYQALSKIWGACAQWQPNTPWGNTVNYGGYGPGTHGGTYDASTGTTTYPATKQSNGNYSYYDRSLGKWITRDKDNKEVHGAAPKALPAGTGSDAKSAPVVKVDWPAVHELDDILGDIDRDNPWLTEDPEPPLERLDLGQTEDGLRVTTDATRASMIAQVKDIVKAMGRDCEVEALVDDLQEAFGTVDVETIPHDILMEMTEEFENVSTILASQ